ncbi:NADH dehydrogenase [ubiquinone] 1 alpha subcomplex subunit 8-like [Littorina saxatilis]|uniref:NADH dehydrogenase [ubiquinone] 1 alpha subcomplex subunit 8 n=1 Tax=Littorina saxatilis TaxID=31220 RepID=A0AAN9ASU0_9CAEN
MAFTNEDYLPSKEELTVPELELTSSVLRAGAHHFGKYCDKQCKEFMLCVSEDPDPRKCIPEGKEVTRCGFEFFGKVKQNCFTEFTKYFECIDHSDRQMSLKNCRPPQSLFDECMKNKLGQDRPFLGYFSSPRIHVTERPKPQLTPHKLPERIPDPPDFKNSPDPEHKFSPYGV